MHEAIARNSVHFNARYNVQAFFAGHAINEYMADDWFERLVAALRADGRGMRALSLAAKCGPNYIQQMINDGKRPTVDKLLAILGVLGHDKAFEILTGTHLSKEDFEFLEFMSQLDVSAKEAALSFFRALLERQQTQAQPSGSQGSVASKSPEPLSTPSQDAPFLHAQENGTKKELTQERVTPHGATSTKT